jgi:hypothetical protein
LCIGTLWLFQLLEASLGLRLRFFYQIIPHGWGASFFTKCMVSILNIIYLDWIINQVLAMERSHVDAFLFFC